MLMLPPAVALSPLAKLLTPDAVAFVPLAKL
jgi:hypothetical protein